LSASREEQHQLRQALKILLESEKQLRVSHDRPTWLTAALLQFAPDRSYVPSSVDTSMAPSPIAFETLETVIPREPYTPRLPNFRDIEVHRHQAHYRHPQLQPQMSHMAYYQNEEERLQSLTPSEGRRCVQSVIAQSEAKVHPAHSPLLKARNSSSEEVLQSSSNLLYDGHQVLAKSCDFHLLGHGELKDVWTKVLHSYRSDVLRQLMQAEGSLVSLSVANGMFCTFLLLLICSGQIVKRRCQLFMFS
jgi:DNA polymerase III gamma/tau subunit